MILRKAKETDIWQLFEMLANAKGVSPYKDIPAKKADMVATIKYAIANKLACCLVVQGKHKIEGIVVGSANPLWYNAAKKNATTIILTADNTKAQALLTAGFLDWAWSLPSVSEVTIGTAHAYAYGMHDQVFEEAGLQECATAFTMVRPKQGKKYGNR